MFVSILTGTNTRADFARIFLIIIGFHFVFLAIVSRIVLISFHLQAEGVALEGESRH